MAKELIINASLPELRIALTDEGEIQELLIERKEEKGIVGNIYKGRVTRVLPGMQAAFVDIGLEKAAFLYVDDVFGHSEILDPKDDDEDDFELDENGEGDDEESQEATSDEDDLEEDFEEDGLEEDIEDIEVLEEGEALSLGESESESESPSAYLQPQSEKNEVISEPIAESEERAQQPNETHENEAEVEAHASEEGLSEEGSAHVSSSESTDEPSSSSEKKVLAISKPPSKDRDERQERQKAPFLPPVFHDEIHEEGESESDRSDLSFKEEAEQQGQTSAARSQQQKQARQMPDHYMRKRFSGKRPEFRQKRDRTRRINSRQLHRRYPAKIENLLKEGQDVIVQVAKDPIAQKGARLTCHVSLAGRHLVCMPTIDHVGVSRRIERFDERRRLRDYVEKNKPKGMGFIIRTASGGKEPETWIKNDIDYLKTLWSDIAEKASAHEAPALIYEDVNSALRALRDWIDEDIHKIIIDSRYHFNEVKSFCEKFMPALSSKIELYHGDIPLFDAYGISQELNRAMERKVWLKSGGYLVIDQAEALVAIDVNTGRFVGQKNLEDTILKTNLEAVREVAYQMRIRNSGGIIIIDLIDMEREENKAKVVRALEEELKKDRSRPSVVRISELGLIELTRKRTRDTMVRILGETCPHCEGKGFIKSKGTVAYELLRNVEREGIHREVKKILIQAHPDVIDILAIDEKDALDQLEKRYRKKIFLQAVHGFHQEQFEIIPEKNENAPDYREEFSRDRSERGGYSQQQRPRRASPQPQKEREDSERGRSSGGRNRNDRYSKQKRTHEPRNNLEVEMKKNTLELDPDAQPLWNGEAKTQEPLNISPHSKSSIDSDEQPRFEEPTAVRTTPLTDEEEEDRLAFLRAQAAQDAAIASLGSENDVSPSIQGKKPSAGRQGRGPGGATNRNNRNSKFSRNANSGRGQSNRNGGRNNNARRGPAASSGGGQGGRPPRNDRPSGYHRGGVIEPRSEPVIVSTAPAYDDSSNGDSSTES